MLEQTEHQDQQSWQSPGLKTSWNGSEFDGVLKDDVSSVWPHVEKLITSGLDYTDGTLRSEDVLEELLNKSMQLWVSRRNGKVEAVCITTLKEYATTKICEFVVVAGNNMQNWIEFEGVIMAWARSHKCDKARAVFAREGWLRAALDWKRAATIIEKVL
jgi:hypothetical protein